MRPSSRAACSRSPLAKRDADRTRADPFTLHHHRLDDIDTEAELRPGLLQQRHIGLATDSKPEVTPDHNLSGPHSLTQQFLCEGVPVHALQALFEAQHDASLYTRGREQLELLAQTREARGRARRLEVLARCRLERHDRRGHTQTLRMTAQSIEHRLVTEMHAVEVANRDCAPAMSGAQVVQPAHEFHQVPYPAVRASLPRCRDYKGSIVDCSYVRLRSRRRKPHNHKVAK